MAEELKKIKIKVHIAGRSYPLTVDASEEEAIRKAAKILTQKTEELQHLFTAKDTQDLLAIAALEFASLWVKSNNKEPDNQLENQLEKQIKSLLQQSENLIKSI
jgi:cell division protein ZapA (FtsZ GTPase activity inhibitor)